LTSKPSENWPVISQGLTDLELLTDSILFVVGHREEARESNVDEDKMRIHLDDEFTVGNLIFKATNVTITTVDAVVVHSRFHISPTFSFLQESAYKQIQQSTPFLDELIME
jgi:hypothetical protein